MNIKIWNNGYQEVNFENKVETIIEKEIDMIIYYKFIFLDTKFIFFKFMVINQFNYFILFDFFFIN